MFQKKFVKNGEEKRRISTGKNFLVDFLLIVFIVFSFFYFFNYFEKKDDTIKLNDKSSKTVVLGEGDQSEQGNDLILESENYQTPLITFGGNVAMPDNLKEVILKIGDVKSELLTTKDQEETKLLISWKTNKPAISEIEYGKNSSQTKRKEKESKYDYSHSLTLSSLEPATAYVYKIKSKDKWGNEENSENFAFYTGAPNISLIDLLLGAFKDVFGWAMKDGQ